MDELSLTHIVPISAILFTMGVIRPRVVKIIYCRLAYLSFQKANNTMHSSLKFLIWFAKTLGSIYYKKCRMLAKSDWSLILGYQGTLPFLSYCFNNVETTSNLGKASEHRRQFWGKFHQFCNQLSKIATFDLTKLCPAQLIQKWILTNSWSSWHLWVKTRVDRQFPLTNTENFFHFQIIAPGKWNQAHSTCRTCLLLDRSIDCPLVIRWFRRNSAKRCILLKSDEKMWQRNCWSIYKLIAFISRTRKSKKKYEIRIAYLLFA